MLFDLQQVRRYMTEPEVRRAVQNRVAAEVDEDTGWWWGIRLGQWWRTRRCALISSGRCGR